MIVYHEKRVMSSHKAGVVRYSPCQLIEGLTLQNHANAGFRMALHGSTWKKYSQKFSLQEYMRPNPDN